VFNKLGIASRAELQAKLMTLSTPVATFVVSSSFVRNL